VGVSILSLSPSPQPSPARGEEAYFLCNSKAQNFKFDIHLTFEFCHLEFVIKPVLVSRQNRELSTPPSPLYFFLLHPVFPQQ
jgi:hypothetical protein